MKKIINAVAISAIITTAASAGMSYRAGVGVNAIDNSPSALSYSVGVETIGYKGSHVFSGLSFDMTFSSVDDYQNNSSDTLMMSLDYHYGYIVSHKLSAYLLGGLAIHKIDSVESSSIGFGYGGGIGYRCDPVWSTELEYKKYLLSNHTADIDYDLSSFMAIIKYSF